MFTAFGRLLRPLADYYGLWPPTCPCKFECDVILILMKQRNRHRPAQNYMKPHKTHDYSDARRPSSRLVEISNTQRVQVPDARGKATPVSASMTDDLPLALQQKLVLFFHLCTACAKMMENPHYQGQFDSEIEKRLIMIVDFRARFVVLQAFDHLRTGGVEDTRD